MGGVPEILKSIASIIAGAYISFHATIVNMGMLYKLKGPLRIFRKPEMGEQNIILGCCKHIKLYCITEGTLSYFQCCCCCKSSRNEIEIYNKGCEKLEEDFDMVNYIKNMRNLN